LGRAEDSVELAENTNRRAHHTAARDFRTVIDCRDCGAWYIRHAFPVTCAES
jgi:hypothetical protein